MRENIGLFRAKRVDNGEWVQGYFTPDFLEKTHKEMIEWAFIRVFNYENTAINIHKINKETLCECTGMKDKNGKLIFEGDIVKYKNNYYNDLTAIVEQKEARYGIWDKTPENKVNDKYCFIFNCICMYLGQYEVIGNKFDNKEFLGE